MARSIGEQKVARRVSIGLTEAQYEKLLELAEKQRVSLGWVVRDVIDKTLLDLSESKHSRKT